MMNRLFCIYLPVLILTLVLAASGLKINMAVPVSACMFPTEQISKPEPAAHIECCRGFLYHFGADEGITTHGRRFGLNKLIKTNFYNRHNECDGKERSFKCLFTSTRGLFTRLLTTRHAQGFYIYSLRVLLL